MCAYFVGYGWYFSSVRSDIIYIIMHFIMNVRCEVVYRDLLMNYIYMYYWFMTINTVQYIIYNYCDLLFENGCYVWEFVVTGFWSVRVTLKSLHCTPSDGIKTKGSNSDGVNRWVKCSKNAHCCCQSSVFPTIIIYIIEWYLENIYLFYPGFKC